MKLIYTHYLMLFLIGAVSTRAHAQEPHVALEIEEYNILYRGYANKIHVAVSNANEQDVVLKSNDLKITKDEGSYYIVKPINKNRDVSLDVLLANDGDTSHLRTMNYRVSNLPDPYVYWGYARDQAKANIREKKLFVKYPPEIPLHPQFNVVSWELTVDSTTVAGEGDNIEKAEKLLRTVRTPQVVTIVVLFGGPDDIYRKRHASWTVDPWEEMSTPGKMVD